MENMFPSKSPRFPSEQQVLPPIVTNEKDRQFLVEVSGWLEKELSIINQNDIEQCYTVYRQVFSQVNGKSAQHLLWASRVDFFVSLS
jgi:hypothetical protein